MVLWGDLAAFTTMKKGSSETVVRKSKSLIGSKLSDLYIAAEITWPVVSRTSV